MKLKEDKQKFIFKNLKRKKRKASSIVYNTTNINYINIIQYLKNKSKNFIKKSSTNFQFKFLINKVLLNLINIIRILI